MKFSIVIPVAPERGAEIIGSIKKLDYDKSRFHVVVVQGKNTSDNRNKGFERAKGEFIIFLDDDGVIKQDYLKKVEKFLENDPEIDVVGGPQLTPEDDSGFARISGYALSSKFGAWKIANRYSCNKEILDADETFLTSANMIVKKKVMEKVKFDPGLFPGEDPKFIADAKKEGFKIAYSPDIVIYHRRRPTVKSLIKQIFNYGKVRPLKERFSETVKMPFFFIPSIFLIYLVLLIGLGIAGILLNSYNQLNLLTISPLLAYLALSIIFAIYDSSKNKDYKAVFILPFIYPLIHLSYGAGMIYGYFKKLKR